MAKYGPERYQLLDAPIAGFRERFGSSDVVFCRDVVHHQLDPFAFLRSLLQIARKALVLRTRTRDIGETLLDAERSCQYHYARHWVPFIVINTEELIQRVSADPMVGEVVISRRYEPLGCHNSRYLPKDLFYRETGSAETALIVLKQEVPRQGAAKVTFDDRADGPRFTLFERTLLKLLRLRRDYRGVP